jgi:hypothetical protein
MQLRSLSMPCVGHVADIRKQKIILPSGRALRRLPQGHPGSGQAIAPSPRHRPPERIHSSGRAKLHATAGFPLYPSRGACIYFLQMLKTQPSCYAQWLFAAFRSNSFTSSFSLAASSVNSNPTNSCSH